MDCNGLRWKQTAGFNSAFPQLRWNMFSKFQCEISNLPPTNTALKCNIFRCHYVTLVLRRSLSTLQNLPSPLNYGWESSGEAYLPILTDKLPAPLALIELSGCSCKTRCATNRRTITLTL